MPNVAKHDTASVQGLVYMSVHVYVCMCSCVITVAIMLTVLARDTCTNKFCYAVVDYSSVNGMNIHVCGGTGVVYGDTVNCLHFQGANEE